MCIMKLKYPCGHCYECLSKKRSDWSIRMQEEFKSKGAAYHAILTYEDKNLPRSKSGIAEVRKKDCQDFLKRFRYYFKENFTYFLASEYGEFTQRPHYHILIFASLDSMCISRSNFCRKFVPNEYMRQIVEKAWQKGFVRRKSCMVVSNAQIHYVTKDLYHFTSPLELYDALILLQRNKKKKLLNNFLKNSYEAFVKNGFSDDRAPTFRLFSKGLGFEYINNVPHIPDSILRQYSNCFLPRVFEGRRLGCPKGYTPIGDFFVHDSVTLNFEFDEAGNYLYPRDLEPYLKDYEVVELRKDVDKSKLHKGVYALPRYYREKLFNYDIRGFIYLKYYFKHLTRLHDYKLKYAEYDATHETPYYLLQAEQEFQYYYQSHKDKYNKDLINGLSDTM